MERLTRLFLFACLCLSTSSVNAQQITQDSYLLAGDVQTPEVRPYPTGTQMTVQRLLMDARQAGVQGTATVLRGQPLTVAATELCPPASTSSAALLPGDIVIFRALQGWNGPQNVVRVSSSSVDVHNLTRPVTAGQLSTGDESPAFVFRSEFGRSTQLSVAPGDIIQHGDVVILGRPTALTTPLAAGPASAGGLDVRPASSPVTIEGSNFLTIPGMAAAPGEVQSVSAPTEPSSTGTPFDVSPFDTVPPAIAADEPPAPTVTAEETDAQIASLTEPEPAEQGTANAESLWNGLFVLGIVLALGLITIGWVKTQQEQRLEQEAAARMKDGLSAGHPQIDTQPAMSDIDSVTVPGIVDGPSLADATTTDAPASNTEFELSAFIPQSVEASNQVSPPHDAQVDEDCPVLSAGIEPSQPGEEADNRQVTGGDTKIEPKAIASVEVDTLENPPSSSLAAQTAGAQLVAPTEWFGEDWRKPIVEEPEETAADRIVEDGSPIADTSSPIAEELPTSAVAAAAEVANVAESRPATDMVPAVEDDIDDTEIEVLRQRQAAPPAEVLASFPQPEVPGYSEPQPVSQERQDVEDLIENRIPVNLQQASLPLSVSLYGKPSGPKRLRIDAAHTEIAPPHMMSRSRRGRRPAQSVKSASTTAPVTKPTDSSETAGLDKALNYIDEQLDK
ncbi:MAG: hypothetical protein NXI04_18610 [Planctomycetaceae bacterium]|nr:hypothetical protein [Planctomycetaceae bacterium]